MFSEMKSPLKCLVLLLDPRAIEHCNFLNTKALEIGMNRFKSLLVKNCNEELPTNLYRTKIIDFRCYGP